MAGDVLEIVGVEVELDQVGQVSQGEPAQSVKAAAREGNVLEVYQVQGGEGVPLQS